MSHALGIKLNGNKLLMIIDSRISYESEGRHYTTKENARKFAIGADNRLYICFGKQYAMDGAINAIPENGDSSLNVKNRSGVLYGYIRYDDQGAGSSWENKDRMFICTAPGKALKIQSGGNLSIEAASGRYVYFGSDVVFGKDVVFHGHVTFNGGVSGI